MDGPKDPWPRVLSLPGAQGGVVGDPTSLARDNMVVHNELSHYGLFYHEVVGGGSRNLTPLKWGDCEIACPLYRGGR